VSSRERILATVHGNQPPAVDLPAVPLFDHADGASLWPRFCAGLERMGGRLIEAAPGADLNALCRELFPDAKVICSATDEVAGTRTAAAATRPQDFDDVDVTVVRALFGIAETGSVFLDEAALVRPASGFLAQHLIVLLDPATVVDNLHHACHRGEFRDAPYGVLMTGPSATADIEGVLIRGAQGVRSLTLIAVARR
jgi:L-lactate dehydrogenase complex protein LldG